MPYYYRDFTVITSYIPKLTRIIERHSPEKFRWDVKMYEGKAHVPPASLYDGLSILFKNYRPVQPPVITPGSGRFPLGESLAVSINESDYPIRYTLDGQEPTRESPIYQEPIILDRPATVKAKAFRENITESWTAAATFELGALQPSQCDNSGLKKGLRYGYYEKQWFLLPDSIDIDPVAFGIAETISTKYRRKDEGFLLQFEGYIQIPREGMYTFSVSSTLAGKLFIDGSRIIYNRCTRTNSNPTVENEKNSHAVRLEAGMHAIRVVCSNAWFHGLDLKVSYQGPGIKEQEIPSDVLYHKR
jgi:hypothetical protein